MPIIKSAKKRVRTATKATIRNKKTRRNLKTALKAFHANITGKKASDNLSAAHSEIDKAVKKGVMHKNKAARKKKQLATAAKANNVKQVSKAKKPAAKKAPAKAKATPKKAVNKKPAAKKAPAKKPAAKKTTKK